MTGPTGSRGIVTTSMVHACLLLLSVLIAGCGTAKVDDGSSLGEGISRIELGNNMRAYKEDDKKVFGIIVWFHGMDSDGTELQYSPRQRHFVEPFLRRGWVVASATAGGNSFGNDKAVATYRELITAATTRFAVSRMLFVGESMGALAGLHIYAQPQFASIDGFVGISPLMGLPATIRDVDFIRAAWHGDVPERADPLAYPSTAFAGRRFQLHHSLGDRLVPDGAGARAFAIRFGNVASIELDVCQGGHIDPTCYQGDAALRFATESRGP
ncbi:hypothetical protein [Gordonia sp. NPDC003429]